MRTPEELVVLVDDANVPIGTMPKSRVHTRRTPLHRGFSVFLFKGPLLLLQQRSFTKKTWPGVWSNSCCGHPAPGEDTETAIRRRVRDELGLDVQGLWELLPEFRYHCERDGVVENEICPVWVGRVTADPLPNPREVADWEWVSQEAFIQRLQEDPEGLSEWCVLEAAALLKEYALR